jgi:hypothetical protein
MHVVILCLSCSGHSSMPCHGLPPACLVRQRLQRELSYFAPTERSRRSRKLSTPATSLITAQNHPPSLRYTRGHVSSNAASARETSDALSLGGPLTLLHKTSSLISRVLPPKERIDQDPIQSFEFWDELLADALDDLSALPKGRKTRIVGASPSLLWRISVAIHKSLSRSAWRG